MLHRAIFTISPPGPLVTVLELPMQLSLDRGGTITVAADGAEVQLMVERTIDPDVLVVVPESGNYEDQDDGTRLPLPRIRLTGEDAFDNVVVNDVINALAFLTDVPLHSRALRGADRFVAETTEDQQLLERFGTDQRHIETGLRLTSRTFSATVDADAVRLLLDRSAGLRLYSDALKLSLAVARYRELWRVLESAFQRRDDELIQLLAAFSPARAMRFTEEELKGMLILRGRASHAQSKAGQQELIDVERECGEKVARLKNLVERVVLTKKSWGYPSTGVEELAPLRAFVRADGRQVFLQ
ncbi:MAG: hypothetical protein JWQ20_1913 [Conexibacter sp.]|nr:hypothetical protein [Conexibacter sp.]